MKAFEVLDGTDSIPSIVCEETDLPRLPPISLDPVGEQVQSNTQALHTLGAAVSGVEDKLAHFMEQIKVLLDSTQTATTRESVQTTTSFAKVVSSHPPSVQPLSLHGHPQVMTPEHLMWSSLVFLKVNLFLSLKQLWMRCMSF